ncbi:hypothetical protein [Kribbella koreensis]|uniref:hypothetical protein n=1 Tax=Kribbella koreensis TaxID=57909 RepID=UPI0031DC9B16
MSGTDRMRLEGRIQRRVVRGLIAAVTLAGVYLALPGLHSPGDDPPAADGYWQTMPAGSFAQLPTEAECAERVHRSEWEPRPGNSKPNQTMPAVEQVHTSLAVRPRATPAEAYDTRWDSLGLARVTGHHTGTTDENIQWAACKWGLADNLVRAVAVTESTWYQKDLYPSGACVEKRGCGDLFPKPTAASGEYCNEIKLAGYDYQRDYGQNLCPKTFSIIGVMSWQDPAWGQMAGNQNGTFPFNRDSTAFALDYYGAYIRGCLEGWAWWLTGKDNPVDPAKRLDGCVGAWFAGAWHTKPADDYTALVFKTMEERPWLNRTWASPSGVCSWIRRCGSNN